MSVNIETSKNPLYISLGILMYFTLLMLVNYFQWDFVLIGVFVELLTIPALLGLVGLLGYSVYRSFWGVSTAQPIYRMTAGVLLVCALMLVAATFYFG
jgi:hypothetical protein